MEVVVLLVAFIIVLLLDFFVLKILRGVFSNVSKNARSIQKEFSKVIKISDEADFLYTTYKSKYNNLEKDIEKIKQESQIRAEKVKSNMRHDIDKLCSITEDDLKKEVSSNETYVNYKVQDYVHHMSFLISREFVSKLMNDDRDSALRKSSMHKITEVTY